MEQQQHQVAAKAENSAEQRNQAVTNTMNVTVPRKPSSAGYSGLAKFMLRSPDVAIFRKFGLLNMMNLLRLQAELHDLEQQLEEVWKEDRTCDDPVRNLYGLDFRFMKMNAEEGDSTQYDLLEDIGKKLKDYSMANVHFMRTMCLAEVLTFK